MSNIQEKYFGIETFTYYLEILIKRRHLIIRIFTGATITMFIIVLTLQPYYVAVTTLLPPEQTDMSPLGALQKGASGLLGLNLNRGGNFSELYAPIIKSHKVITKVLRTNFKLKKNQKESMLLDILVPEEGNIEKRIDIGYKQIVNKFLTLDFDGSTGIISIYIETKEPQLSADIANKIVYELNEYVLALSLNKAKESKVFIEERLSATQLMLMNAEKMLKVFRETNKRIENSPDLQLKQGRLLREVRVQEQVYLTLKKEFEMVKIDEVKNLPKIRILDEATPPIKKSKPKRRLILVLTVFLSLILGIVAAFGVEYSKEVITNQRFSLFVRQLRIAIDEDYQQIKSVIKKVFFIKQWLNLFEKEEIKEE